ncbi:protein of unknown function [Micropruina glycogenica]|uniref:Uncharacterized protein n=1 Tax=Micropruina glycogenica TaxID=75385 RepID=A0A2N9JMU3_9ACTN|nr:protein of unknown function [Micropruina glycogenica]
MSTSPSSTGNDQQTSLDGVSDGAVAGIDVEANARAPRVGVEPTSLILIQSQAGPAGRPTGDRPLTLRCPRGASHLGAFGARAGWASD